MSTVVSLICLGPSFQKMTHYFLLHGSLRLTNHEKYLKPCPWMTLNSFCTQINYYIIITSTKVTNQNNIPVFQMTAKNSINHSLFQSTSIDHFWSIDRGGYNRLKPPLVLTTQPWFSHFKYYCPISSDEYVW